MEKEDLSVPLDPSFAPALLYNNKDGGETSDARHLYSIPKRRAVLARGFDGFVNDVNWVTPQGWVLVLDPSTRDASLRDPFSSRTVPLPPDRDSLLADSKATRCVLSTTETDPGCIVVVVVHREEPTFCYCRPGSSRWFKHEYRPELLLDGDDRQGTIREVASRLTAVGGRFYAHHFGDHKLTMLTFSPSPTLTSVHVVDRPWKAGYSMEYRLVESCKELFMVRFCFDPIRFDTVIHIEVSKMDTSKNAWGKVEGLGSNRVFFVGTSGHARFGVSMAADELDLKPNGIYFTKDDDKGLYVYDMKQGTTAVHNPGTDIPDSMQPVLLVPACDLNLR